jgi:hypothetical protein
MRDVCLLCLGSAVGRFREHHKNFALDVSSCLSRVCGMTAMFCACWVHREPSGEKYVYYIACDLPCTQQRGPKKFDVQWRENYRAFCGAAPLLTETFLQKSREGPSVKWPIRYIGSFFLQSGWDLPRLLVAITKSLGEQSARNHSLNGKCGSSFCRTSPGNENFSCGEPR